MDPNTSTRQALHNKTNLHSDGTLDSFFISPPKRSLKDNALEGPRKRLRFSEVERDETTYSDASESDVEMEDFEPVQTPKTSAFQIIHNMHRRQPNMFSRQPTIPTRLVLQSFVSANKADTYRCDSTSSDTHLTPPYACAYSHTAKRGGKPLLAVATEEGTVHVVDTSKRRDWDCEPQRTILQPHQNGIFDVKWHHLDDSVATASGDHSVSITSLSRNVTVASLSGHSSTAKCVNWNPGHTDILCSGGRDGNILVWDLRAGENRQNNPEADERQTLSPVIIIPRAHEDVSSKPGPKGKKVARSVTSVNHPTGKPFSLISSGSFDGILREWDVRFPTRKTKSPKKQGRPLLTSPLDPTILSEDSRRARGITDITLGFGPTEGLLFALGYDSQIRTYHTHTLDPVPHANFSHLDLQSNSFYVKTSISSCGKWLATGSSGGKAFLFDISNTSGRLKIQGMNGIELRGHTGEVGAIDWGSDMLATSADDGTVRIWRPDAEVYRKCIQDPNEERWNWCWANAVTATKND